MVDSLRIGGAEVMATSLATGLVARGHSCSVCGLGIDGELAALLSHHAIPAYAMKMPFGVSPRLMLRIACRAIHFRADVIVTHHFRQLFHGVWASFFPGKTLVHIEHDHHFYQGNLSALQRLAFLLKFVDAFVVVSTDIANWFIDRIPQISGKIKVIENGVDTDRFRPDKGRRTSMRRSFGIEPDVFVVGTCARLEPIKNLSLLIDAFAKFHRDHPRSQLCIVGDGSQKPSLQEKAKDCKVEDSVRFLGLRQKVEECLALFDVYAISSHNEGLPISVLEAMSSGLPIVATPVGALPRLLDNKAGILASSPLEVSAAFADYAASWSLVEKTGAEARRIVSDSYSADHMVASYEALMKCVLQ